MYLACLACQKFFHDWPELRAHHFERYWSTEGIPNKCFHQHFALAKGIYHDKKEEENRYSDFDYGDDRLEAILTRINVPKSPSGLR